jgi:hypothetical protein
VNELVGVLVNELVLDDVPVMERVWVLVALWLAVPVPDAVSELDTELVSEPVTETVLVDEPVWL